jgi:hypothetical protein
MTLEIITQQALISQSVLQTDNCFLLFWHSVFVCAFLHHFLIYYYDLLIVDIIQSQLIEGLNLLKELSLAVSISSDMQKLQKVIDENEQLRDHNNKLESDARKLTLLMTTPLTDLNPQLTATE